MLRALRALREHPAVEAVATAPKDIPVAVVRAVKDSRAAEEEDSVAKVAAPEDQAADRAVRVAAASANISARRKFADSASSAWTSSTTRRLRCSSLSFRSEARFCRAA
jgi:hypothetical protein